MSIYPGFNGIGHPCELYMRISEIKVKEDFYNITAGSPCDSWKPPELKAAFEILELSGWLKWTHGDIRRVTSLPQGLVYNDETSIFWDPGSRSFIQGPFNCLEFEFADNGEDTWNHWSPITFETPDRTADNQTYENFWCMGHRLRDTRLGMPMTVPWKHLLGSTYFHSEIPQPDTLPSCGFAGRLSLILGLFTLAVTRANLEQLLRECFFPRCGDTAYYNPTFTDLYSGAKNSNRGVVVEVAYENKDSFSVQSMEAWTRGRGGPILTSSPVSTGMPTYGFPI